MLNTEMYKEQLQLLRNIIEEKGFLPLDKIIEVFNDSNDELLDDVVAYYEALGVVITKDTDDLLEKENLLDDEIFDVDDEIDNEIKVEDFQEINSNNPRINDSIKLFMHEIGQYELLTSQQEVELARKVQDGIMAQQKLDLSLKSGKRVSQKEQENLQKIIEIGEDSAKILIESNLRLVVYVAKKFVGRGLQFSDLIQEGSMGLMKSVAKFDPTKGFKFSTYATWWIRQSINRAIADQSRTIRIPVHIHEFANKLSKVVRKLTQEKHRNPTPEEISEVMGVSVDKVIQIQQMILETKSLDDNVGDDEDSVFGDYVSDTKNLNPLNYTEKEIYKEELRNVLHTLTPREEKILCMRFGLDGTKPKTLEEIGKEFNITRERIRQIEAKALRRLRHPNRLKRLQKSRIR